MYAPCLSGCWSKSKSLEMKMNAETQRNAEKRRENVAAADLCNSLLAAGGWPHLNQICGLKSNYVSAVRGLNSRHPDLSNTPFQRGGTRRSVAGNRFNDFPQAGQTVETVRRPFATVRTPLKRGVKETNGAGSGMNCIVRSGEVNEKLHGPSGSFFVYFVV